MTKSVIGYVPGVWDMLHVGHLSLLEHARSECDRLIVGVSTDELVVAGQHTHPVVPFEERLEIVGSLRVVDFAVRNESLDKLALWSQLRFDVLFQGDDWQARPKGSHLERDAKALGVRVRFVPYSSHTSSMRSLETLLSREAEGLKMGGA
jgi:glycerol-3-phosphate cytidylyltransferase